MILTKMDQKGPIYEAVKNLMKQHFQIKAIIQDILSCRKSMEELNKLNELGRYRIGSLRDGIDSLELYAKSISDDKLLTEVESQRHQLASTLKSFKEANITSMFAIEKIQREELLKSSSEDDPNLRNRRKKNGTDLLKVSSGVTEQLFAISRQLADTTQRSQDTLDTLASSSSTVSRTKGEIEKTAGSISQSSKLLKKYGRREFTDKIIVFFAFLFFLAVCLYIVHKRLF